MATILKEKIETITKQDTVEYLVRTIEDERLIIASGTENEGFSVNVLPYNGKLPLNKFAKIIEGCFSEESNFFKIVENLGIQYDRKIKMNNKGLFLTVSSNNANAEKIIALMRKKEKLKNDGLYYIIGVRRFAPIGQYDGICFVLEVSEKAAIEKIHEKYGDYECTCLGRYTDKTDTLLLQNASKYFDSCKIIKIEE